MLETLPSPSPLLLWGFTLLPIVVAGCVIIAISKTNNVKASRIALIVYSAWMALTGLLSWCGMLDSWTPPRMFFIIIPMIVGLVWASRQKWTDRLGDLSLSLLVGFQSFRIIVELLLHQAVTEGIAHPTMTWSGTNLDIIPGATALLLAPFADRLKPSLLQAWNLISAAILVVTVVTGISATPSPFRQIMGEPANGFVAGFPYVWLPAILVSSAWLGHIVLFRRLRKLSQA